MQREQWSTGNPIPFQVVRNVGDYLGAGSILPTVQLSKDGNAFAAAKGAIAEIGSGWYALLPDARDRDVLGSVAMQITVPVGDVTIQPTYEVVRRDSRDRSDNGYLADIAAYSKAMANYLLPTHLRFP